MGASETMLQFFSGAYCISVIGDACSRPGRILYTIYLEKKVDKYNKK